MTTDGSSSLAAPTANVPESGKTGVVQQMFAAVRLLRPAQWIKNALVLAPLVFAGLFLEAAALESALVATAMFSLTASIGYVYNDLQDIEADRRHPVKRHTRPLASGELSPAQGWTVMGVLLAVLLAAVPLVPWTVTAALGAYLAIGVVYSSGAKQLPVLDLFVISAGFVLRVYAGAEAISVVLSPWMAITTLCLALYLGTVKRLAELRDHGDEARTVLDQYDGRTLEGFALVTASCGVVFYALYTAIYQPHLAVTLPLVLFGFLRYWHLIRSSEAGSSPIQDALADRQMVGTVALYGLAVLYLLWPG